MNTPLALPQTAVIPQRKPLLSLSVQELAVWLTERGWPRFHATSLRRWLLERRAEDFATMTDLPKKLRIELEEAFTPLGTAVVTESRASDGTCKLLLKMWDGETVECVMIPEQERRTACISTQVGCGMACVFCASGLNGVLRNLHSGEILEQLLRLRNALPAEERLNHIVVMGMGEPLANLENLLEALAEATSPHGLGVGARHITISTVGLPVKIRRLAELKKQYHLAVSLHAPNDELRNRIVPTNLGLEEILAAADYFHEQTGRQVTYEYVLLRELNDSVAHAQELARLLQGRQAHINLIPFNEVEGLPYRRPTDEALKAFGNCLKQAGLSVKVRKRKGSEIDAACGQLRRRMEHAAQETVTA
jgi:23S rRNA (adenine2503-C2)-methyltransferase